ncbi:PLP-dependent aminotransferase family protein [Chengkuizengella sediminis]|uniref:MocR-like pyridoxine biosynthesis transcription factor PdxR n=1 Tax=Chengkuizengella sediminis TaxID=1885917 RepID=UPI00138A5428|nr:PLP-dependent aminotransferase family protein [Chengkuizengella sediminis]NDI36536.1 PLP-dependent aminotransferase family protein [Chengkuizengella sediminis]
MDFHIPLNSYLQKYRYKYAALYHAIHDEIITGKLKKGTKLPSTRQFAMIYEISRGIVNQVYEMLTAEGYLSSEVGKGTFIIYERKPLEENKQKHTYNIRLSDWGERLSNLNHQSMPLTSALHNEKKCIYFKIGSPDLSSFPYEAWNRCLYAQIRETAIQPIEDMNHTRGYFSLRKSISLHLLKTRGIQSTPEEIVIVNGSMQAIALCSQLLINPKDQVIVENPCYKGIHKAIQAAGGIAVPMDVEKDGIQFQMDNWQSKLAFVTPSRQYPTGVVLNLSKRQKILEWANNNNAWIIEDDYDSEFRFKGRPIEPLKVLDHQDRVIYIGTFSKTMKTELRIGYVVLPKQLVQPFYHSKQLYEPHATGIMEQRALTSFINQGLYERHLRKMTRIYQSKHLTCLNMLKSKLSHLFSFNESDAGLHIFGKWLLSDIKYDVLKQKCGEKGVFWTDSTCMGLGNHSNKQHTACFGFSHLSTEDIKTGINLIASIGETLDFIHHA